MSDTKFTPGPWHAKGYPTISATGGGLIAKVLPRYMDAAERKANANLIAAAPQLYAALEVMLERHRNDMSGGFLDHDEYMIVIGALDRADGKIMDKDET